MEYDVVTLENNKDYIIFEALVYENNKYLILSNKKMEKNI